MLADNLALLYFNYSIINYHILLYKNIVLTWFDLIISKSFMPTDENLLRLSNIKAYKPLSFMDQLNYLLKTLFHLI